MRTLPIVLSVALLISAGAGPASADKCNGAKIKAIGKKEKSLLGCSGKEATKGPSVQPDCNNKASLKFTAKYDKPTGCVPAAPSDSTCESAADACQAAVRSALPDGDDVTPSKCEASRLKAAGKLGAGELSCYAKASSKSLPVDPACLTKAVDKYTAAFNKVSGCTGDNHAAQIQSLVESDCVDNMIQVDGGGNVQSILCGGAAPTTTTSSTTTITTTSSTTATSAPPTTSTTATTTTSTTATTATTATTTSSTTTTVTTSTATTTTATTATTTTSTTTTVTTTTATTTTSTTTTTTVTTTTATTATTTTSTTTTVTTTTATTTTSTTTTTTVTTTTATTTTSTTTTVTTTSSTTTTMPAPCCGVAPTKLSFTTGIGAGNCGTVQLSNGTVSKNLACSGLFTGGGGNTVPLPYAVPDMGTSLTGVTGCNAVTGAFNLTNLTSGATGSNRNCTSVGCLFGPPLPIPNSGSTPTSVCVVNVVATNASGTGNCNTGTTHLNLPLTSQLYLDGDLYPLAPGIQVCPVCNHTCSATGPNTGGPCNTNADCGNAGCVGPALPVACCSGAGTGTCTGTCGGGNVCHSGTGNPGDGNPCTPADSVVGTLSDFPTSHDCPPPPALSIGGLPIAFDLVTSTTSKTAVNNTASGQNNVFCGYCRDLNNLGTGCFSGDPNPACPNPSSAVIACSSNAGCNADYPDCVQRTAGAFGPAGGGAHTINETGSPAGNMTDGAAHASILASIFCIQPTFNATVDAAGDLPGPGAVTLQGSAQLLP